MLDEQEEEERRPLVMKGGNVRDVRQGRGPVLVRWVDEIDDGEEGVPRACCKGTYFYGTF